MTQILNKFEELAESLKYMIDHVDDHSVKDALRAVLDHCTQIHGLLLEKDVEVSNLRGTVDNLVHTRNMLIQDLTDIEMEFDE